MSVTDVMSLLAGAALITVLSLAGCGGDSEPSDVSVDDVVNALSLQPEDPADASDPDPEYVTADGRCRVYQVLTGEAEVGFYADTAGNVATNDDDTVGVRFNPARTDVSDADCADALGAALNENY